METKVVWLLTAREDLHRFLSTFLGSNGYEVQRFSAASAVLEALGRGELPDILLGDDPPPGLPRATIEARLREMGPHVRSLFLHDVPRDERMPDEVRRFATDDLTLGSPELLELVEQLTSELGRDLTPPPGSIHTIDAKVSLKRTITTFVELLERYEFLNGGNGPLVQRYATEVAREMGLSRSRVEAISVASLIYDIGMMRVRPEVKLKTSPLTQEELDIIHQHPRYGAEFCESLRLPWDVSRYVRHHHERFDGTGYPDGLAGHEIPTGARIIAVGDAYFAMISKRANRDPKSEEDALAELQSEAGTQFDPEIVEVWTSLIQVRFLGELPEGALGRSKRIALVDDDRELSMLLESRFADLGYELVALTEPGEMLSRLVDLAPEAILVRADLSSVDAWQLLHRVRQEPRVGGVPFVMVSGSPNQASDRARASAAGADDFLVLPCPLQELIARVNGAIRRKSRLTGGHFVRPTLSTTGIRGRLSDMALAEICQLLAQGLKTAKVTIEDTNAGGELYFREGKLSHVQAGGLEGPEAFYSLLRLHGGDFSIEHGVTAPKQTIEDRVDFLLMEGMRLMDEESRQGERLTGSP